MTKMSLGEMILAIIIVIITAPFVVALFVVALALFVLIWVVGFPIKIKVNGIVTGYVRWFKYTAVKR